MLLKIVRRWAIACLGCALALAAAEVWNSKDYTQWSDEDISQILTNSPWAKKTNVTLDGEGMGPKRGVNDGAGTLGSRGRFGDGGQPGARGGEYEGNGGGVYRHQPEMTVVVRWDSALPVQLALRQPSAKENTEKYVISVVGLAKPHIPRPPGAPPQATDDAEIRDQLVYATRLMRKGQEPIPPDDVHFDHENGVSVLRFIFPRGGDPISSDDKEVTFATQVGAAKIEQKFRIKEMTFKGKPAL